MALGGHDPLRHFTAEITMAFQALEEQIEKAVARDARTGHGEQRSRRADGTIS